MKIKNLQSIFYATFLCLFSYTTVVAQVGIGTTNPAATSMLDIQSNSKGILIPRMTLVERNNIVSAAQGLQVYNSTNNTLDIYIGSAWKSFAYSPTSNLVNVYSLADLPTPAGTIITLNATKMYIISGNVDISPNYIVINGAGLRGTDPEKDIIASNVSGAVLRSTNTNVYMQNLAVMPLGASSRAFDFSDTSFTKFCNLFAGTSVVESNASLGVGQISGFKAITIVQNFWKVSDGLKITGTIGKFCSAYNFIEGLTSGTCIEILSTANIQDVDISNTYFNASLTGIKINSGAVIERGRLTTNMFRQVTTPLTGVIDSFSPGWSMSQNTQIPDSRAFGYVFYTNNPTSTTFGNVGTFVKIAGTTTAISGKRFTTSTTNRLTYTNVDPIVGKVSVVIGAQATINNSDFTIGIAKNGVMTTPRASMFSANNNDGFQIVLNCDVDFVSGDFIEVFITRNNTNAAGLIVEELQFGVSE